MNAPPELDLQLHIQHTREHRPQLSQYALLGGSDAIRGRTQSLADHLEYFGSLPDLLSPAVIAEAEHSGLLGRGGAGFPVHRKLAAVARHGRGAVVVANGTESEPASRKDRTLLALRPHLVIDGAVIAARAVGAQHIVLSIHDDNPRLADTLNSAIAQRRSFHRSEPSILLTQSPRGFVAGESTAVVSFVNGDAAKPVFRQRNADSGVRGLPTLVQNVETLAHLAIVVRIGATAFRTTGSPGSPGTRLLTLTGAVREPGKVIEMVNPRTIGELLSGETLHNDPPQAVLIGGYGGTFLSGGPAMDTVFDKESLSRLDVSMGCGLIGVLPQGACGLRSAASIMRYLAQESAGQCGPCLYGLPRLAEILEDLVSCKIRRRTMTTITKEFLLVEGRGACSHPDAAVALMRSALDVFHGEVLHHLAKRCTATDDSEIFDVPRG